ncbi:unnamed protein product [Heterobilharzia americana]|nr:unnamed protein product [Heterobilharzia americana]
MVIDEKSIGNELASDSLSASLCKFTELVTKLHDSIDHFVTKYPVFDDMKSSLLDNSANGSDVPIEDAFLGIHKDIRYLTDHLACANFIAETPIQLHQFRYNFVHEEQEDSKTKDKYVCNFDLKDECRKLKSVIENLKEQSEVIRHALSQKLQNVGADFLPEAIFLYNDV